jgi:dihydroorotase-like cyclic amidohydrolase
MAKNGPNTFVALTATTPAKRFDLYGRKESIAPGFDADLVRWDAERAFTLTNTFMQHAIDYTPLRGPHRCGLAGDDDRARPYLNGGGCRDH